MEQRQEVNDLPVTYTRDLYHQNGFSDSIPYFHLLHSDFIPFLQYLHSVSIPFRDFKYILCYDNDIKHSGGNQM